MGLFGLFKKKTVAPAPAPVPAKAEDPPKKTENHRIAGISFHQKEIMQKFAVENEDYNLSKKEMIAAGDKWAELCYNAMIYTFIKWTCMMAGALGGKVDGILMTGGLAYDQDLVKKITENVEWIAPVFVYPGSYETEALGAGVERVLAGEEQAKTYSGHPVWEGFDFIR